jgi:DNA-binding NarL/FixJ family response regulator
MGAFGGRRVVVYTRGSTEIGLRLLDAVRQADRSADEVQVILVGEPGGPDGPDAAAGPHADSVVIVRSRPAAAPRARTAELLSVREREVIGLIAQAYTNRQIASRLGIAEGTVKRHVNSIFVKLGAVSRLDAVNKYGLTS